MIPMVARLVRAGYPARFFLGDFARDCPKTLELGAPKESYGTNSMGLAGKQKPPTAKEARAGSSMRDHLIARTTFSPLFQENLIVSCYRA